VLVVDVGDALLRDRDPAVASEGQTSIKLMNAMAYDAAALGETDLALLGIEGIRRRMEEAQFPILSANVYLADTDELLAPACVVREISGHQVALLGLTGPATIPGVEIRDPVTALKQAVAEVRDQADILILLSHLGMGGNRRIAKEVPELDVILSGGGNEYAAAPQFTPGGPVVVQADASSPGHAGRRLGVGTWSFDPRGNLLSQSWEVIALTPDISSDPEIAAWVREHL